MVILLLRTQQKKRVLQQKGGERVRFAPDKLNVGNPNEPSFIHSGRRRPKRGGKEVADLQIKWLLCGYLVATGVYW